jgi:DNA-binding CsgD family transcriptional regulator
VSVASQPLPLVKAAAEIAALPARNLSFHDMVRSLMELLRRIVPCDTVNLGTLDLSTEEGFHHSLDGFLMPPERRALLPRFKHQNPMVEYARRNGINPPLRFSDFMSRREFEELPIYQECYRGYTHSMITFGVEAPEGLNISFVLSRASGEFSDAERDALALLQGLVSNVIHRQVLKEALGSARGSGCTPGVAYGTGNNFQFIDDRAAHHLRTHLGSGALHVLPQKLATVLEEGTTARFQAASQADGTRLLGQFAIGSDGWNLHLWEEGREIESIDALVRLGLTSRQIDVLRWVAAGRTNAEIAIILGISYRTVQKHLESLYRALGVDSRMGAVRRCRDLQLPTGL